jgi:hypothetical protein
MAASCAAFTIHARRTSGRRKNYRGIGLLPVDQWSRPPNRLAEAFSFF